MINELKYVQGDIIKDFEEGKISIIAHACNQIVGMKGGIAKILCDRYRPAFDADEELRETKNFAYFNTNYGVVANIYCMIFPGVHSTINKDTFQNRISILKSSLESICKENPNVNIGLPLVLSGLARDKYGSNYSDLEYFKNRIADNIKHLDLTIYYL